MPRLSVDIDLVYLNYSDDRQTALANIKSDLDKIRISLKNDGIYSNFRSDNSESKLIVNDGNSSVKIEVNEIMRGTLMQTEILTTKNRVYEKFRMERTARVLAREEIYAGKFLAALDRGHPRDLFDVMQFYESLKITPKLMDCFVSYLCCHNRTFADTLDSPDKDISELFKQEFDGMTAEVTLDKLIKARSRLKKDILSNLSNGQKEFLLSFAKASPNWEISPFKNLKDFPAIKWKLSNLENLYKTDDKNATSQYWDLYELIDGDSLMKSVWICDECGKEITDSKKGKVLWKYDDNGKAYGFKIVHHKCDDGSCEYCEPIQDFLHPDGQEKLLLFLSNGTAPIGIKDSPGVKDIDEFIDFFRRLRTPNYEKARRYFMTPITKSKLIDSNSLQAYLQNSLEKIVKSNKGDE